MSKSKKRLDVLLFDRGLTESREKAKALVMSHVVYVDDNMVDKPGTKFKEEVKIEIKGHKNKYVSRGGKKLEKALNFFDINITGFIAIDIGASTGGFTDCLLQNGANKVYAIDVGYGQLAWKLRQDDRVIVMERTNIRYVTPDKIGDKVHLVTVDVSFISLTKVLGVAKRFLLNDGIIICLIKPQFEAGREQVGKKGVVRDPSIHREVIEKICRFCMDEVNISIKDLTYSPIKGPEGNIEYLLYLVNNGDEIKEDLLKEKIVMTVTEAHNKLKSL